MSIKRLTNPNIYRNQHKTWILMNWLCVDLMSAVVIVPLTLQKLEALQHKKFQQEDFRSIGLITFNHHFADKIKARLLDTWINKSVTKHTPALPVTMAKQTISETLGMFLPILSLRNRKFSCDYVKLCALHDAFCISCPLYAFSILGPLEID